MKNQNSTHRGSERGHKIGLFLKLCLCIALSFWIFGSLDALPSLQTNPLGSLTLTIALSVGLVSFTYITARMWLDPDRGHSVPTRLWIMSALTALMCAFDIAIVHARIQTAGVNFLGITAGQDVGYLAYLISLILITVNLALSVHMANAYYAAGLHEKAKIRADREDEIQEQIEQHNREITIQNLKHRGSVLGEELRDALADTVHRMGLRSKNREAKRAMQEAQTNLLTQKAEALNLEALQKKLANDNKRAELQASLYAAANDQEEDEEEAIEEDEEAPAHTSPYRRTPKSRRQASRPANKAPKAKIFKFRRK